MTNIAATPHTERWTGAELSSSWSCQSPGEPGAELATSPEEAVRYQYVFDLVLGVE